MKLNMGGFVAVVLTMLISASSFAVAEQTAAQLGFVDKQQVSLYGFFLYPAELDMNPATKEWAGFQYLYGSPNLYNWITVRILPDGSLCRGHVPYAGMIPTAEAGQNWWINFALVPGKNSVITVQSERFFKEIPLPYPVC
jgi:hypothetical protein